MRNHRDNIKNEIAYFYTVIKNMNTKDNIKQSKINEHELPLYEIIYDNFSDNFDMDKQIAEQSLLSWIDLIENENLHKAVKSLSIDDQIFISYIVKECKTQRELACVYKIKQQNISKKINKILNKIKTKFVQIYKN